MTLGAETNTRWLWFITYILLPLNVAGQVFVLFWLLDVGQGGVGLVFILAELCLAIVTILGLHQQKPWGWYCIMVMFGIQLVGTPLKVHAKASMRYEVNQSVNSYLQSQGRYPLSNAKPSLFDSEPMLSFFLLMVIWTIPNTIYMFRRRKLFGVESSPFPVLDYNLAQRVGIAMVPSANRPKQYSIDDSAFYAAAMKECDGGADTRRASTWARAFSMMEGDEIKTKAKYIELRVAELVQLEIDKREKEASEQREQRERQRREETARAQAMTAQREAERMIDFSKTHSIGKHFPALFKHFGHRVIRMTVETDAGYAARLQRFARDFEKETGMKLE
jgi:hypothetical protein